MWTLGAGLEPGWGLAILLAAVLCALPSAWSIPAMANNQLHKKSAEACPEPNRILVNGTCQDSISFYVVQCSLFQDLVSPDGFGFKEIDTFRISISAFDSHPALLAQAGGYDLEHSLIPKSNVGIRVWFNDQDPESLEEIVLPAPGRIMHLRVAHNGTIGMRTNAGGVSSFGLVAKQRLVVPRVRIWTETMDPHEYLEIEPSVAVLSTLAALGQRDTTAADPRVNGLNAALGDMASELGGMFSSFQNDMQLLLQMKRPPSFWKRDGSVPRLKESDHVVDYQLTEHARSVHDPKTDVVFAKLLRGDHVDSRMAPADSLTPVSEAHAAKADNSEHSDHSDDSESPSATEPSFPAFPTMAALPSDPLESLNKTIKITADKVVKIANTTSVSLRRSVFNGTMYMQWLRHPGHTARVALHKFTDALRAIPRLLKGLPHVLKRFWHLLKASFAWKDIAISHDILATHIEQVLPAVEDYLKSGERNVMSSINETMLRAQDSLTGSIKKVKSGKFAANAKQIQTTAYKTIASQYAMELVLNNWNGSFPTDTLIFPANMTLNTSVLTTVNDELEKLVKNKSLTRRMAEGFKRMALDGLAGIMEVVKSLSMIGFRVLEATTLIGFALLESTILIVKDLYTMYLPIPLVAAFYEKYITKGRHRLSLSGLYALLGAWSSTVMYKLTHDGRPPFDRHFLDSLRSLQPSEFINLVTGEATTMAKLGGDWGFHLYFGYFKLAFSSIDIAMSFVPMPGLVAALYFTYFDFMFVPIIPLCLPGAAAGISKAAWSLFIFTLVTDFYNMFIKFVPRSLLPTTWIGGYLGSPAETEALAWAAQTMWNWARNGVVMAVLAYLYEELFKFVREAEGVNEVAKWYLNVSIWLDMMSAYVGLVGALIPVRPSGAIRGLSRLGWDPAHAGSRMWSVRITSNMLRIASGIAQISGAQYTRLKPGEVPAPLQLDEGLEPLSSDDDIEHEQLEDFIETPITSLVSRIKSWSQKAPPTLPAL